MSAEMKQNSSHTATTSAETVEVDTGAIDIDMDLLKKERQRDISDSTGPTRSHSEKWTGLNDSAKTGTELGGKSNHEGSDHSRSSHRRGRMPRRNSNSSTQSFGSVGSAGSRGSKGSKGSSKRRGVTKRRSWKKPKDKPKRPLSAYNIFFKHTRSRIVEGLPAQGTTEETIASIEGIVANSTETRRHRKTHGQISFGDLARTIADQWKTIDKNERALFDHYASLDMKRYRRDVSIWKAKKEAEALSTTTDGSARLDISGNSNSSLNNYLSESQHAMGVGENYDDWNTPQNRALSESFNSVDSNEDYGLEPLPFDNNIAMQQDNNMQMGRSSVPSYIGSNNDMAHMMSPDANMSGICNGGYNSITPNSGGNSGGDPMQNKKLHDIWMKNRQLEDSINKLKKELSQTNFSLGNNNDRGPPQPDNSTSANSKFLTPPFPMNSGGPSIDRMQQLHRGRMLKSDVMANDMNNNNNSSHGNSSHSNNIDIAHGALGIDDEMALEPFDMNPVPFEEVFNSTGEEADLKKKELITNLNHLDLFGTNNNHQHQSGGGHNC